jgi:hypothetical protein
MTGTVVAHHSVELHLPSRDRHGMRIDSRPWVERALDLMCREFRGAYEEKVVGYWVPPSGARVTERTSRLVSYVTEDMLLEGLPRLLRLAAEFMDATDQAAVLVAVDGQPQAIPGRGRGPRDRRDTAA